MPGGRFNKGVSKVLPGTYINFESGRKLPATTGNRGTVLVPIAKSDYGPAGQFIKLTADSPDAQAAVLGHSIYEDGNRSTLLLKEAMKRPATVYAYILTEGTKASGTGGGVTAVAKFGGSRGNKLTYTISANPVGGFDVDIHLDGDLVAKYEGLATLDDLVAQNCPYIDFSTSIVENPAENALKLAPLKAATEAYGKTVGELQKDVTVITDGTTAVFKGTLNYVTGYTEFNKSKPEEQAGNYLAIDLSVTGLTDGDTYDVYKNGSEYKTGISGSDKSWVIRVSDPTVKWTVKTSTNKEITIDLSHLSLTDEEGVVTKNPEVLEEASGVNLSGGTDKEASNDDVMKFIDSWESVKFDTVCFPFDGEDSDSLKEAAIAKVKFLRESIGKGVQVVIPNAKKPDYEGVINVTNSVEVDGIELTTAEACAWVAGATAGATNTEALTYKPYDGATKVVGPKTSEEAVKAIENGEFFFTISEEETVVVMQDINSFVTFTSKKDKTYRKNRILRVYDTFQAEVQNKFAPNQFSNTETGWDIMEGIGKTILTQFEDAGAIQNVDYDADFLVDRTISADDETYFNVGLQAADSAEKLYFTITTV